MNDRTNPYVPDQTMAQGATPTGVPVENPTGTLAAPASYKPVTRGGAPITLAGGVEATSMAGRYALLRALAKGGMGQVHVARDTELDRDVALKEIQPRFRLDDATLHRFMLEARVTGKLEHPGVVPVYGLGTYDDGRPYYAMRFITGSSLQDAIEAFHVADTPTRDPQERTFALRQLLRRYIDVCNTIGYAHSRGILHRDLKPANVMLGGYGETLVVDWGLAKEMIAGAVPMKSEETLLHEAMPEDLQETQEGFTMYGQTMGTPAYMSPEQAAGKWDITGVGSDVYSLGAMLYVLLSGSPPYSGPSYEVITKVQKGEYKPVKLVKGSVPSPLDAIVRKAMAFDIADRYPTALELATDVERWLADEPVSCYREPFLVRAQRWARRHRTGVITAGVMLLTGALALAVGLVAVKAEQQRTETARLEAVASRSEARDALLTLTDDAVGEMLVGSATLSPQQLKYLDSVIEKYRKFTEREPDSDESQRFTAGSWYRIGRLQGRVNRYAPAVEAYDKAWALTQDDNAPPTRQLAGEIALYRGILDLQASKPGAARWLETAITLFTGLVSADPKPEYRFRLSQARDRLGVMKMRENNVAEAKALFQQALDARRQLAKEYPEDAEYQFRVAQSLRQLAGVEFALGGRDAGLAAALEAREAITKLVALNGTSAIYLALLGDVETVLADYQAKARGDALPHARAAAKVAGTLAALNPGDATARRSQAEANINLARILNDLARAGEANTAVQIAVDILTELNRDKPNDPLTGTRLVKSRSLKMHFLALKNDKASLAKSLGEANDIVKSAEELEAKFPANREVKEAVAEALISRAYSANADGQPKMAKADLDAAWPRVQAKPAGVVRWYVRALVNAMAEAEDYSDIVTRAAEVQSLPLPGGLNHVESAALYCRAAQLVKEARKHLSEDMRTKLSLQMVGKCVEQLRLALQAGYRNAAALMADTDFNAAWNTVEFKDVIAAMNAEPTGSR